MAETVLIGLAASDVRLPASFQAFYAGHSLTYSAIKAELARSGLKVDELDAVKMPPETNMVFGSEHGGLFDIVTVSKVRLMERLKLKQFNPSVGDGSICKMTTKVVSENGVVREELPVLFRSEKVKGKSNWWMPINPLLTKKERTITVTKVGTGEWAKYDKIQSTIVPYPELAIMMNWSAAHCWNVRLSMPDSPGLLLATDPVGVRELLKMRDVPEGRTRRQALVHWVSEHWRKNRKDPSVEHLVREHLRGATDCDWFGLHCKVLPVR